MFMHSDTYYTPFHWLAYHNDAKSIEFLLGKLNHESIDDMIFMKLTKQFELTSLDIAGRVNATNALDKFLDYFKLHRETLCQLFLKEEIDNTNKVSKGIKSDFPRRTEEYEGQIQLKLFDVSIMTEQQ